MPRDNELRGTDIRKRARHRLCCRCRRELIAPVVAPKTFGLSSLPKFAEGMLTTSYCRCTFVSCCSNNAMVQHKYGIFETPVTSTHRR
ncbi:uncharacterized protein SEPMUDRAFT_80792 [Sphaerulina musiva SO2202]|uniref:Uncharacterized protein n=1 Tax=Sphaerulina musiva (strain SO2202) TaxID=692275 RepID=M3C640_SPHMS|nr:uncharacterized protein SEPMUDRAFT_80792 [Sphaerulina musiva SO2202]EMF15741.1 hypothetical protein SEPMUDRAFT_80792 [Sphaerulina musiva SO2202]